MGFFDDPEEAARAYDRAAIQLRGDKATTNFPRDDYDVDPAEEPTAPEDDLVEVCSRRYIIPCSGLVKCMQDPITRGHGIQYLYRCLPARVSPEREVYNLERLEIASTKQHLKSYSWYLLKADNRLCKAGVAAQQPNITATRRDTSPHNEHPNTQALPALKSV